MQHVSNADDSHHDVSAVAAANDDSRRARVDDELGDLGARPELRAVSLGGCHLGAELLEQRAGDRVSVGCLHG
jgi:hypothetical protein